MPLAASCLILRASGSWLEAHGSRRIAHGHEKRQLCGCVAMWLHGYIGICADPLVVDAFNVPAHIKTRNAIVSFENSKDMCATHLLSPRASVCNGMTAMFAAESQTKSLREGAKSKLFLCGVLAI